MISSKPKTWYNIEKHPLETWIRVAQFRGLLRCIKEAVYKEYDFFLFWNVCYCEIDKDNFNVDFFNGLRTPIVSQNRLGPQGDKYDSLLFVLPA